MDGWTVLDPLVTVNVGPRYEPPFTSSSLPSFACTPACLRLLRMPPPGGAPLPARPPIATAALLCADLDLCLSPPPPSRRIPTLPLCCPPSPRSHVWRMPTQTDSNGVGRGRACPPDFEVRGRPPSRWNISLCWCPPYIPYSLGEGDNMVGCLMIGREVVGVAHVDMQGLRVRFFVYVKS